VLSGNWFHREGAAEIEIVFCQGWPKIYRLLFSMVIMECFPLQNLTVLGAVERCDDESIMISVAFISADGVAHVSGA